MPDNFPPTEEVLKMKKGGMSDYQIKKELEKKGYSFQQISEALNQADIKSGVEEGGNSGMQLSAINEEKSEVMRRQFQIRGSDYPKHQLHEVFERHVGHISRLNILSLFCSLSCLLLSRAFNFEFTSR